MKHLKLNHILDAGLMYLFKLWTLKGIPKFKKESLVSNLCTSSWSRSVNNDYLNTFMKSATDVLVQQEFRTFTKSEQRIKLKNRPIMHAVCAPRTKCGEHIFIDHPITYVFYQVDDTSLKLWCLLPYYSNIIDRSVYEELLLHTSIRAGYTNHGTSPDCKNVL